MVSFRTLKIFLAVVKFGTFAEAGKQIGLTPAAVGLQIRMLEEELNQILFDRGARSVALNTDGRKIVPYVEDLLARYEVFASKGDTDELSGMVVMGAIVSALMGAFADALWNLKKEHPRLEVKFFAGMSSDFADKVERGELDAAIITQPPRALSSSLIWTRLYSEPMILIVPRRPRFSLPDDPIEILRRSPFIRFDKQTWTGYLIKEVLNKCDVTVQEEIELNSTEAIVEIVRQGFGISIIPQTVNVKWLKEPDLSVVTIPNVHVQRHVGLLERVQHNRMQFTNKIKAHFDSNGKSKKATVAVATKPRKAT